MNAVMYSMMSQICLCFVVSAVSAKLLGYWVKVNYFVIYYIICNTDTVDLITWQSSVKSNFNNLQRLT